MWSTMFAHCCRSSQSRASTFAAVSPASTQITLEFARIATKTIQWPMKAKLCKFRNLEPSYEMPVSVRWHQHPSQRLTICCIVSKFWWMKDLTKWSASCQISSARSNSKPKPNSLLSCSRFCLSQLNCKNPRCRFLSPPSAKISSTLFCVVLLRDKISNRPSWFLTAVLSACWSPASTAAMKKFRTWR